MQLNEQQIQGMLSDGMTNDDIIREASRRGDTLPDEKSGFWGNLMGEVQSSFSGVATGTREAVSREQLGQQGRTSTALQTSGELAKGALGTVFAPIVAGAKTIAPETTEQISSGISGGVQSLVGSLSDTNVVKGLADYIERNPQEREWITTTLKNISSAGDIASLATIKPTISLAKDAKTISVGGAGKMAKIPVEKSLSEQLARDIIDQAGENISGKSKAALGNKGKIASREGVTAGPSGTLLVDEMKLPSNQSIIEHASKYAVAGNPAKTVENLVDAIDTIRVQKSSLLKNAVVSPVKEMSGTSFFTKIYGKLPETAARYGASQKTAKQMVKDFQDVVIETRDSWTAKGLKIKPAEVVDEAISRWKVQMIQKNPGYFDPLSPLGSFNKAAAKEVLDNARDYVSKMLPEKMATEYKALHKDWYWKQEAIDNVLAKTKTYPLGTSKTAIRFDEFYQKRVKSLSTVGAAIGSAAFLASGFMGQGAAQAILSGLTGTIFAALLANGSVTLGGKIVKSRTVKRALISESAKLDDMFKAAPNDLIKAKIGETAIAMLGMINVLEKRELDDADDENQ